MAWIKNLPEVSKEGAKKYLLFWHLFQYESYVYLHAIYSTLSKDGQ